MARNCSDPPFGQDLDSSELEIEKSFTTAGLVLGSSIGARPQELVVTDIAEIGRLADHRPDDPVLAGFQIPHPHQPCSPAGSNQGVDRGRPGYLPSGLNRDANGKRPSDRTRRDGAIAASTTLDGRDGDVSTIGAHCHVSPGGVEGQPGSVKADRPRQFLEETPGPGRRSVREAATHATPGPSDRTNRDPGIRLSRSRATHCPERRRCRRHGRDVGGPTDTGASSARTRRCSRGRRPASFRPDGRRGIPVFA